MSAPALSLRPLPFAAQPSIAPPLQSEEPPYFPLTVDHYHDMIKAGILTEQDRVELIEGRILAKMPTNPPHHGILSLLARLIVGRVTNDWAVRVQMAVTLPLLHSEPEPDLVLARGSERRYRRSHPHPEDVALLVEVSDSTLFYDRGAKLRLYAQAAIPVYWIVNVQERCVEVYERPLPGEQPHYLQSRVYRAGEAVPLVLPGLDQPIPAISVDELFAEDD